MARTDDNAKVPVLGVYGQNSAPTFAQDLTEVADDMADIESAEVAALSDLPLTGNWVKRTIWVDEVGEPRYWNGSEWVRAISNTPAAIAHGTITDFTSVPAGGYQTVSVTFPDGIFSSAPDIVLTPLSGVPDKRVTSVASRSSTGFTATQYNGTGSTGGAAVSWIAVDG